MKTCPCGRAVRTRGMCNAHYARWLRGDPRWGRPIGPNYSGSEAERFLRRVGRVASGCTLWQGFVAPDGYGQMTVDGRTGLVHRFAWTLMRGPIPEGLVLDHLCRVRHCVNVQHLEPVTMRENVLRGVGISAANSRKVECHIGHPYTEENTYYDRHGKRQCRSCRAASSVRREVQRKALRAARA